MDQRLVLKLTEIFDSVQGEGASAGAAACFVRLALCNLRCSWCDSKYTWDFKQHVYEQEVRQCPVADLARELYERHPPRLILTGGEPLLQQPALAALIAALPASLPIEVETNGTLNPRAELLARVDQWNISPKLANCGEPAARRLKPNVLSTFATLPHAWLKFVVESKRDVDEVEALLGELAWPRERVLLMPQARSRNELKRRLPQVQDWCLDTGLRLSRRLHVELWDGERGR